MKERYYSNGKLLLTGEYVVLDGANALALPTKFGQDLCIEPGSDKKIHWTSFDHDESIWFTDTFSFDEIADANYEQKTDSVRTTLLEILHEAYLANPSFIQDSEGYTIKTHLTFPKFWGLGTSSTLINNIAQWLKIDAYDLLKNSFGGSGYDIACAQNDTPILYRLENSEPIVEQVAFNPSFADDLYFVYLNKKQSSKAAIASYYKNRHDDSHRTIAKLNTITEKILNASDLADFSRRLENHEAYLSDILEMRTVREAFFSDFNGAVKSLGGWGGDFMIAASQEDPTDYFTAKGFATVIPYREMIL